MLLIIVARDVISDLLGVFYFVLLIDPKSPNELQSFDLRDNFVVWS